MCLFLLSSEICFLILILIIIMMWTILLLCFVFFFCWELVGTYCCLSNLHACVVSFHDSIGISWGRVWQLSLALVRNQLQPPITNFYLLNHWTCCGWNTMTSHLPVWRLISNYAQGVAEWTRCFSVLLCSSYWLCSLMFFNWRDHWRFV